MAMLHYTILLHVWMWHHIRENKGENNEISKENDKWVVLSAIQMMRFKRDSKAVHDQ